MEPPQYHWGELTPEQITEVTTLSLFPNQGNNQNLQSIEFSAFFNMKILIIMERSFQSVRDVVFDNLPNLATIRVCDHCFNRRVYPRNDIRYTGEDRYLMEEEEEDNDDNDEYDDMAEEGENGENGENGEQQQRGNQDNQSIFARLSIRNCPQLHYISIGCNSFRRFYRFELSQCPSLHTFHMKKKVFRGVEEFILQGN